MGALAQTLTGTFGWEPHDSLYRFDGFEFEKYTPIAGEPLDVVTALLSTAEGLWAGLRAGGVRAFHYPHSFPINPKSVMSERVSAGQG